MLGDQNSRNIPPLGSGKAIVSCGICAVTRLLRVNHCAANRVGCVFTQPGPVADLDAWAERVSCRLLADVDAALEQQIRDVAQR